MWRGQGGECPASWPGLHEVDRSVTVLEYQGPEQRLEPGFPNAITQRVDGGLSAGSLRKADTAAAEPVMDELMGRQLSRGGGFAARTLGLTYPDYNPGRPPGKRSWFLCNKTKPSSPREGSCFELLGTR